jgi:acyl-[acyl-carrier-protein] desaturase
MLMSTIDDTTRLLHDLEPVVTENLERHLATAKDWMPHEYVPWSQGRDYADLGGTEWHPDQTRLSPVARTALEVNLLTEDNLPSYHREIHRAFGRDGAWGTWVHRWTAEEGRHAYAIRDYLLVTRGVNPEHLETARMHVMQTGFHAQDKPLLHVLAYVSLQELATRISHRNTGRHTHDPHAEKLLTRVATDENLHMIFYRNLITAALDIAPDATTQAITDEILHFTMPGAIIPGFTRKAAAIAQAGIYDLRIHHDDILMPLLRHWNLFDLTGLGPTGETARDHLATHLTHLDTQATRFEQRRAQTHARTHART